MKKFLCLFLLLWTAFVHADTTIWTGEVKSDGTKTEAIKLKQGGIYKIKVSGTMGFGNWWKNGKPLMYDAFFEFNAMGEPTFIPVFQNSLGIAVSDSTYKEGHVYESQPFAAPQEQIQFWIYDTDYRDNSGSLNAEVIEVSAPTPATTSVPETGGIYIVATQYTPNVPSNLPENQKPSQYLKMQDPTKMQWDPSADAMLFFFGPEWKSELNSKDFLKAGQKFWTPMNMEMKDKSGKSIAASGGMLFEVKSVYATLAEMNQANPPKTPGTANQVFVVNTADGKFTRTENTEQGSTLMNGGPIEKDWTPQGYEQAQKFYVELYQALGCFVATAVYQDVHAPQLSVLRKFRDQVLEESPEGKHLVALYYRLGPKWAEVVKKNPEMQKKLRPLMDSLVQHLEDSDIESEASLNFWNSVLSLVRMTIEPEMERQAQEESQALTPNQLFSK